MVYVAKRVFRKERANDLALAYWQGLKGNRVYPRPDDVTFESDVQFERFDNLRPNLFMIHHGTKPDKSVFTHSSEVLDSVCDGPTIDRQVADCLPVTLRDSVMSFIREMAREHKPLAASSRFVTDKGNDVLFRTIFMPLGNNEKTQDSLLGAFSCRQLSAS